MAEIKPFRAWRYRPSLLKNIGDLTSPLFDVATEKQREVLYGNSLNSIHLSIPRGNQPAKKAAAALAEWKRNKVIIRDNVPGIYVYYQYFSLPSDPEPYCRKGFICKIRIQDWQDNIILRHENVMDDAVDGQLELLAETRLNASPTHGLYTDASFELEPYMDACIQDAICKTEDYQGVIDILGIIQDETIIAKFIERLKGEQVILADGHHRYAGSLAYMKRQMADNPAHTGNEGYNYHLMWLTNTEANDLRILPTHRLAKAHQMGMGIAAMKVVGGGVLGALLFKEKMTRQKLAAVALGMGGLVFTLEIQSLDLSVR